MQHKGNISAIQQKALYNKKPQPKIVSTGSSGQISNAVWRLAVTALERDAAAGTSRIAAAGETEFVANAADAIGRRNSAEPAWTALATVQGWDANGDSVICSNEVVEV